MYRELDLYQQRLQSYIEATYHLSHPQLVALRSELLSAPGAIAQEPFLESTPRYTGKRCFSELQGLPDPVRELLSWLGQAEGGGRLVFDPPYSHQADALEKALGPDRRDLVVTTGTGSGKTETFLLPVVGRLAEEAALRPESFQERGVRALLLYPMNALVNDQLGRLRLLLGAEKLRGWFTERAGRPVKFARYTGRSLYPGVRTMHRNKHAKRLAPLKFYTQLEDEASGAGTPEERARAAALIDVLQARGKWPAKAATSSQVQDGMSGWIGRGRWQRVGDDGVERFVRSVERPQDAELLLRQEVHDAPPDLLVTNYSMLEYMLLRPIERGIFRRTRDYFAAHPEERLVLILDEAHLYRGAQGTEISMLIRRLRSRLGLSPDRVQVICTSASFSSGVSACAFAAQLCGKAVGGFEALTGTKQPHDGPAGAGTHALAEALASVSLSSLSHGSPTERAEALRGMLALAPPTAPKPVRLTLELEGLEDIVEVRIVGLTEALELAEEDVEVMPGEPAQTEQEFRLAVSLSGISEGSLRVARPGAEPHLELVDGGLRVPRGQDALSALLHSCLRQLPPAGRLLNLTSGAQTAADPEGVDPPGVGPAQPLRSLGGRLFPGVADPELARRATDALVELCSTARASPGEAPLLAARAHRFFRGLPGLWACVDSDCTELAEDQRGGPTGQLYAEPRRTCGCGARVYELLSCRDCGSAFLRAYTLQPASPDYLWAEQVRDFDDAQGVVGPVELALQEPRELTAARQEYLDLRTGRIAQLSGDWEHDQARPLRDVWIAPAGSAGHDDQGPGTFASCPCCGAQGRQLQDHVTKGDEPFMELVTAQLLEQPARPDVDTPLRGRKALIFSDGRQSASRLAGKLRDFSLRDAVRPLLLGRLRTLEERLQAELGLSLTYTALLAGCASRGVDLRPDLAATFADDLAEVRQLLASEAATLELLKDRALGWEQRVPRSVLMALYPVLTNRHTGIEALRLASIKPVLDPLQLEELASLPAPPTATACSDSEARLALVSHWCRLALEHGSLLLRGTPATWIDSETGARLRRTPGKFKKPLERALGSTRWYRSSFGTGSTEGPWRSFLRKTLGLNPNADGFFIDSGRLRFVSEAATDWRRCTRCTRVQSYSPLLGERCGSCDGPLEAFEAETEAVFQSRKGHYRTSSGRLAAEPGYAPHPFVAQEHTAQLNDAGQGSVFSRAERYELRFQDIDVTDEQGRSEGVVDVLSCTTTMEVGIDIGSLTAVALRNVPPGRANYQQRAGRAGRRGSALSTVVTFCGSDPHDQRFFGAPAAVVSGPVADPVLNLDNAEIIRRHCFSLVLSLFQQEVIPDTSTDSAQAANIFESLGLLRDFRRGTGAFSYAGLEAWLQTHSVELRESLDDVTPADLPDRSAFIAELPGLLLERLASQDVGAGPVESSEPLNTEPALALVESQGEALSLDWDDDDDLEGAFSVLEGDVDSAPAVDTGLRAEGLAAPLESDKLLDRLFEKGVLPRYAFPIDVVAFHVFEGGPVTRGRPALRYSPQQGLSQALSAYAPGKPVWVDGLRHWSMALYTPFRRDLQAAYARQRLYYECDRCGYARLADVDGGQHQVGMTMDCPACGGPAAMGPAMTWFSPPGFAHPVDMPQDLPAADTPPTTRPTRAKLQAPFTDVGTEAWSQEAQGGSRIDVWTSKQDLMVTNRGTGSVGRPGFLFCRSCGRIEPNGWAQGTLRGPHARPYPTQPNFRICQGRPWPVTLGHQFRTDIALLRLRLGAGMALPSSSVAIQVALTTLAEALSIAAVLMLEIESSDISGEYRVALTDEGRRGEEFELYLYDLAPGGAGFVQAAAQRTPELLEATLARLEGCDCTHSCYRCLRSYGNRFRHGELDRWLGAALLRLCRDGTQPTLQAEREDAVLGQLAADLQDRGHSVEPLPGALRLPELGGRVVALAHPLAPGVPGSPRAQAHDPTLTVSPLRVERALASAAQRAVGPLTTAPVPASVRLPPELAPQSDGVPVRELSDLAGGWEQAPESLATVGLDGAAEDCFVAELTIPTLEDLKLGQLEGRLSEGAWLVLRRVPADHHATRPRLPLLVYRTEGSFKASGAAWTVGRVMPKRFAGADAKADLRYASRNRKHEAVLLSQLRCLAEVVGVVEAGQLMRFGS